MQDKVLIPMKGEYAYLFKKLEDIGLEVCNYRLDKEISLDEQVNQLKQFKYIVTGGEIWPAELLEKIKGNLKMIVKYGTGVDNIDVDAARELGIAVSNTAGFNSFAVAELTVALILDVARGITRFDNIVKNNGWNSTKGFSLTGKIIGFLGFGSIAGEAAKRLSNFGVKMLAYDKFQNFEKAKQLGVEYVSYDELLDRADIISIHMPLIEETKGIINMTVFKKMKDSAYIINTSRGPIINELDLIEALKNKIIAGAALDVFEVEPLPLENELRQLENAVLTPHVAAATQEAGTAMLTGCVENIIAFEKGNPINIVNR